MVYCCGAKRSQQIRPWNNLPETNRRHASPLGAAKQFGRAAYARGSAFGGGRAAKRSLNGSVRAAAFFYGDADLLSAVSAAQQTCQKREE